MRHAKAVSDGYRAIVRKNADGVGVENASGFVDGQSVIESFDLDMGFAVFVARVQVEGVAVAREGDFKFFGKVVKGERFLDPVMKNDRNSVIRFLKGMQYVQFIFEVVSDSGNRVQRSA